MMELESKPRRKTDYRLEVLDGEMVLYHPSETKILYFNQAASLIWLLCDGERTVAEVISLLSDSYPESAGEIAMDVQTTLQQFEEQGCIELV
jgi:Coenzyme PQQ synthesis protein D (PqqD)